METGQQGHQNVRICPILAAFSGSRDSVSTGSTWAVRCKGSDCGWWDDEERRCAVAVISHSLAGVAPGEIMAQATQA